MDSINSNYAQPTSSMSVPESASSMSEPDPKFTRKNFGEFLNCLHSCNFNAINQLLKNGFDPNAVIDDEPVIFNIRIIYEDSHFKTDTTSIHK